MRNKNWFWGLFFLLFAVVVLAGQTSSFEEIGAMSLLATVLLISLVVKSIFNRSFFVLFISLAFLYMIYWEPLNLVKFSSGTLIFAAILASIGFNIIFHNHWNPKRHYHHRKEHMNYTMENIDNNNPNIKVSFSSSCKYLHADCLKSGQFAASFGSLEVFFDQANLSSEGAEIFLDCSFGSIKLYIPKHWVVVDNLHSNLGDIKNNIRFSKPIENAPCLTLAGNVQLGSIEIKYV